MVANRTLIPLFPAQPFGLIFQGFEAFGRRAGLCAFLSVRVNLAEISTGPT
jgi:hypothetical protein